MSDDYLQYADEPADIGKVLRDAGHVPPVPKLKVIRILGLINGATTPYDGEFLTEYDPGRQGYERGSGRPMLCHLETTPDQAQARRYSAEEAFKLYLSVDPQHPTRPDGKPNRPLTAFSVETMDEDAEPMAPLMSELTDP